MYKSTSIQRFSTQRDNDGKQKCKFHKLQFHLKFKWNNIEITAIEIKRPTISSN